MNSWPPSPSVEDETTALEKEHSINKIIQDARLDDTSVPSRGTVDQYPIIMDSYSQDETKKKPASKTVVESKTTPKRDSKLNSPASSNSSINPLTPPTSDSDAQPRTRNPKRNANTPPTTPRSPSSVRAEEQGTCRGRPQMPHLRTDLGADLNEMITGQRRPPSPYSYTRESGTFKVPTSERPSHESSRSPTNTLSPLEKTQRSLNMQDIDGRPRAAREQNRVEYDRPCAPKRDKSAPAPKRRSPERRYSSSADEKPLRRARSRAAPDSHRKSDNLVSPEQATPLQSRRVSRESPYVSASEEYQKRYRLANDPHPSDRTRDSPNTSSAEDGSHRRSTHTTHLPDSKTVHVRRRSSYKLERPRLDEAQRPQSSHGQPSTKKEDSKPALNVKVPRSRPGPIAPLSASAAQVMEERLARAFQDNHLRKSYDASRSQLNESAIHSAPVSPAHTPRPDRKPMQDYFEFPSVVQHHAHQRSRPLSLEESQIRELRAHTSLLSQATAGATIAAMHSPSLSRSPSGAFEAGFGVADTKPVPGQRSRRPSPVLEEPRPGSRGTTAVHAADSPPSRNTLAAPEPVRPIARSGSYSFEPLSAPSDARKFTRSVSHSATGPQSEHVGPSFNPGSFVAAALASPLPPVSLANRSRTEVDSVRDNMEVKLPPCPNLQPSQDHRGWASIKLAPHLDVCPDCSRLLARTRYYDALAPATQLYRPYVCAMNKPWVRAAVVQSFKQNKTNLEYVKQVTNLPAGVQPCHGAAKVKRVWWRMIDPSTDRPLSNFYACSACMWAVDAMFPELKKMFERETQPVERLCNLQCRGKHFPGLLEQIEQAAARCQLKGLRSRYVQPLVEHARKMTRYRECCRDQMLMDRTWHFIPDLPEFTVCEECFQEVVWPLIDRPVARDVYTNLRPVPLRQGAQNGVSCQLYSDRMRNVFKEAVSYRDFDHLKEAVKARYSTQHRLREMNRLLEEDQKTTNNNRQSEIERNKQIWQQYE